MYYPKYFMNADLCFFLIKGETFTESITEGGVTTGTFILNNGGS